MGARNNVIFFTIFFVACVVVSLFETVNCLLILTADFGALDTVEACVTFTNVVEVSLVMPTFSLKVFEELLEVRAWCEDFNHYDNKSKEQRKMNGPSAQLVLRS